MEDMASPISQTEEEKCKNAIHMVRDALKNLNYDDDGKEAHTYLTESFSYTLGMRKKSNNAQITLLVQGSYANKTNIPSESDVDVAVILESTFTTKYRKGITREDYGFSQGSFSVAELKDDVENALNYYFNYKNVERHDKCIRVLGNTFRVDADVVPAYRYRDYSNDYYYNPDNYIGGIEIYPDSGGSIINYPEQHIQNGVEKDKETMYNFKKCVRIIKNMKEKMTGSYYIPDQISSFGLESLLWNIDVSVYKKYPATLRYTFDEIIDFLINNFHKFDDYSEANGIKELFPNEFTKQLYQDFITDLRSFFQYDI